MPRVIHFEIPADDPERAIKFYTDVFGWQIQGWGGPVDYWLVTTGEKGQSGIDGAIMKRTDAQGSTTNTIEVPDVDEFCQKVVAGGGAVVMSKRAIPGVGYMAYCKDTEGNKFGIMQADPSAQ
jgi:predicted enzyme related to lactoylglutathione lyase